jgi:Cytochrome C oxidase, cbb3-type, subunit III
MRRSSTAAGAVAVMVLGWASFPYAAGVAAATPVSQRNLVSAGQGPVKPVVTRSDYDISLLLKRLRVPPEVFRGRVLWIQRCALCHDGTGQPSYRTVGPWLDADTVKALGEPAMRAIIAAGGAQMPSFRYDLNERQVSDLLAFLRTVTWKPTAAELAYKSRFGHGGE